jgi:BirA family transcriptional regulator, biotin operon repressor / biotin---[acetyl-CoA-carboxylase] ligase
LPGSDDEAPVRLLSCASPPSLGQSPTLGRPRVHLRRTGSTNDRARELAGAGAPHGTLVTASAQTAGRGRQGRRWSAPANSSLLISLVLREPPALLPLIAAVAVCDIAGKDALVKWPNDIVLSRDRPASADAGTGDAEATSANTGAPPLAKLAGILAEGRPQAGWAVLGIGMNVAVRLEDLPLELRAGAATLGYSPDALELTLDRLIAALERRLAEPTRATLDAWRSRDALYGREITWGVERRGHAQGIDGEGRLIVELSDGGHTMLDAGEVHLRTIG